MDHQIEDDTGITYARVGGHAAGLDQERIRDRAVEAPDRFVEPRDVPDLQHHVVGTAQAHQLSGLFHARSQRLLHQGMNPGFKPQSGDREVLDGRSSVGDRSVLIVVVLTPEISVYRTYNL